MSCQLGNKPKHENGYFEAMARIIFRTGLSRKLVDDKWPGLQKAFKNFEIEAVAKYSERDLGKLMEDKRIVRNYGKLKAVVDNAKTFLRIRNEYGSFTKFLKSHAKEGDSHLCKEVSKSFAYMGHSTTIFFLRSVGEKLPEVMKKLNQSD